MCRVSQHGFFSGKASLSVCTTIDGKADNFSSAWQSLALMGGYTWNNGAYNTMRAILIGKFEDTYGTTTVSTRLVYVSS